MSQRCCWTRLSPTRFDMPEPRRVGLDWDDLAEVIFTSGTTGDPKGVMLTHGNLLANMVSVNQHAPGKPTDRLLSLLPLSHMFEQMGGLLIPLRNGANITYLTSIQPSIIVKTAGERKPTLMLLVPQALSVLMNGIEREVARQGKEKVWRWSMAVAQHAPTGVRRVIFKRVLQRFGGALEYIFSGGAALDPELGEKWERIGIRIIQGYGATEASPCYQLSHLRPARLPIGRASGSRYGCRGYLRTAKFLSAVQM